MPQPTDKYRIELQLTENIAIGDGKQANNPWLQELPDPISKVCWDNYASISPDNASEFNLENGDIITIISNSNEIELPVLLQAAAEGHLDQRELYRKLLDLLHMPNLLSEEAIFVVGG